MPGVSAEYRRRRGKSPGKSDFQSSKSRQSDSSVSHKSPNIRQSSQSRQLDSSVLHGSGQMPPSVRRSENIDESNSKANELKFDLSEFYDFYGYDATVYYVLAITKR
jgi:hypothetical protein